MEGVLFHSVDVEAILLPLVRVVRGQEFSPPVRRDNSPDKLRHSRANHKLDYLISAFADVAHHFLVGVTGDRVTNPKEIEEEVSVESPKAFHDRSRCFFVGLFVGEHKEFLTCIFEAAMSSIRPP